MQLTYLSASAALVLAAELRPLFEGDPPQAASDSATTARTTMKELAARHHRTVRFLPSGGCRVDIVFPPFIVVAIRGLPF
jgi:hypothetical protein